MKLRYLLASMLLMFAAAAHTEDELRVITLQHRNAQDLIPLVQPMIAGEGAVTGRDNQLIVRGDASRIAQIQSVVSQLDRAPRRLLITVMQTDKSDAELRGFDANVDIAAGDAGAAASVQTRVYSTSDRDDNTLQQHVQATEGLEAMIMLTQKLPRQDISIGTGRDGSHMESTTQYQNVSSGFYVTPRINGDMVTLNIAQQRAREMPGRPGAVESGDTNTVVSGKLGAWMEIGGVSHEVTSSDRRILGSTQREEQRQQRILVRVTELR